MSRVRSGQLEQRQNDSAPAQVVRRAKERGDVRKPRRVRIVRRRMQRRSVDGEQTVIRRQPRQRRAGNSSLHSVRDIEVEGQRTLHIAAGVFDHTPRLLE